MIFTLVLIAIGILLFIVIGYNIVLQYKQKLLADQRATISRHKVVISETEDLLLNSSRIPYSSDLMIILHNRILKTLTLIQKVDPELKGLNDRIQAAKNQMEQLRNGIEQSAVLRIPDTDSEAVQMLKIIKRLRSVIRSEHSRGRVATPNYVAEDRRLELMTLKVNIENAIKRAMEAQAMRQWGTARQLLNKAITVVSNINDKDDYLIAKLEQMHQMNDDMSEKLKKVQSQQKKEEEEKDDIDVLFQPKKKW
ncbi:DNA repair protein [Celerinatantimonas sp. YJH-8]|uniref:DNA repair protein n=1 Tax=Celerinatantimonas sp. YJH-8 TaxID=3228714 RepID=UPI0038C68BD2